MEVLNEFQFHSLEIAPCAIAKVASEYDAPELQLALPQRSTALVKCDRPQPGKSVVAARTVTENQGLELDECAAVAGEDGPPVRGTGRYYGPLPGEGHLTWRFFDSSSAIDPIYGLARFREPLGRWRV
jgi:hypothetical protein